ncbi:MAG TPA: hypothetical protein VIV12_24040 [Streptosporangiaceae bacterium]
MAAPSGGAPRVVERAKARVAISRRKLHSRCATRRFSGPGWIDVVEVEAICRDRLAATVSRDQSIEYFDSIGLNHELFSPVGTDAFSFNAAGIPASGLLTGQDCCKTQQEVDLFGGYLGNYEGNIPSFDGGCVDNPFGGATTSATTIPRYSRS